MLKTYIVSFDPNPELFPTFEIISAIEIHEPNDSADDDFDDFEAAFRNATSDASASTIRSSQTREQELCSFLACTDVDETTYNYFKEKKNRVSQDPECARKILAVLPRRQLTRELFQRPHS